MELISKIGKWTKEHVLGSFLAAVLSGILLALIFSAIFRQWIGSAWNYVWNAIVSFWNWLFTTHAIHGWLLIALACLALIAIAMLIAEARKNYKIVKKEKELPEYLSYTGENYLGVNWKWDWKKRAGEYEPNTPFAYCPSCSSHLQIEHEYYLGVACINDSCNWIWNMYSYMDNQIEYDVFRKKLFTIIERKVRTEQYKK